MYRSWLLCHFGQSSHLAVCWDMEVTSSCELARLSQCAKVACPHVTQPFCFYITWTWSGRGICTVTDDRVHVPTRHSSWSHNRLWQARNWVCWVTSQNPPPHEHATRCRDETELRLSKWPPTEKTPAAKKSLPTGGTTLSLTPHLPRCLLWAVHDAVCRVFVHAECVLIRAQVSQSELLCTPLCLPNSLHTRPL